MKKTFSSGLLLGMNLLLGILLLTGATFTKSENSTDEITREAPHALEPFIGEIAMFAGNFAPRGWALCNGQLLPIAQNTALFSLLGTTYGGDGRTTFALPDLRGRVPIHAGNGPGLSSYRLGSKGGSETKTLTTLNMPAHAHGVLTENNSSASQNGEVYTTKRGKGVMISGEITGGSQSVDIRQPYQTINYIIALNGVFPSRN